MAITPQQIQQFLQYKLYNTCTEEELLSFFVADPTIINLMSELNPKRRALLDSYDPDEMALFSELESLKEVNGQEEIFRLKLSFYLDTYSEKVKTSSEGSLISMHYQSALSMQEEINLRDKQREAEKKKAQETIDYQNILNAKESGNFNQLYQTVEYYLSQYDKDLFPHTQEVSSFIIEFENRDWNNIAVLTSDHQNAELKIKLIEYITRYSKMSLPESHIEQARSLLESIEYNSLPQNDYWSLVGYLQNHPNSQYRDNVCEAMWKITKEENTCDAYQRYIDDVITGLHTAEAQQTVEDFKAWNAIDRNNIFEVANYIQVHTRSLCLLQAQSRLEELKSFEFFDIKEEKMSYSKDRFFNLLNKNIFTEIELFERNIIPPKILECLRNPVKLEPLEMTSPNIDTPTDHTDVFLLGVPATGKTCILMGLLKCGDFHFQRKTYGGSYAMQLETYLEEGQVPGRTSGNFVTSINGYIPAVNKKEHPINIVEMSGEEFAFKVADNPDGIISFEDMGTNVTQLLMNKNRKVFFIIIDPTKNILKIEREVYDESGNVTDFDERTVNQQQIVKSMINLLSLDSNENIMNRVDSIHFIMTKADMLGESQAEREEKAFKIFKDKYGDIIYDVQKLCKKHTININTNLTPRLFTFSLGQFYIGDIYEYDHTDSTNLTDIIRKVTVGCKNETWITLLKNKLS